MATLEIIGAYDRRTATGSISSQVAHSLTQSRKRKPSYTVEQIKNRAVRMGLNVKFESNTFFFEPPVFDENGSFVKFDTGSYWTASKKFAWQQLDAIAPELAQQMPDEKVLALASEYKADF